MKPGRVVCLVGLLAVGCLLPDVTEEKTLADGGEVGRGGTPGASAGQAGANENRAGTGERAGAEGDEGGSSASGGSKRTGGATDAASGATAFVAGASGAGEAGAGGAAGIAGAWPGGAEGVAGAETGGTGTGGAVGTGGLGCGPKGPSCEGGLICNDDAGTSCCNSLVVEGGSYERAPGETPSYPATVSSFCLDKYEVTVGRMRRFVAAYDAWRSEGNPKNGDGELPTQGLTSGWDADEWNAALPGSAAELTGATHLGRGATHQTWRDAEGTLRAERLPINYVDCPGPAILVRRTREISRPSSAHRCHESARAVRAGRSRSWWCRIGTARGSFPRSSYGALGEDFWWKRLGGAVSAGCRELSVEIAT